MRRASALRHEIHRWPSLVVSAGDGAYFMTPNTGLFRQMLGPISSYLAQSMRTKTVTTTTEVGRGSGRDRACWIGSILRFGVRRAIELRLARNDAATEPHGKSLVPALRMRTDKELKAAQHRHACTHLWLMTLTATGSLSSPRARLAFHRASTSIWTTGGEGRGWVKLILST